MDLNRLRVIKFDNNKCKEERTKIENNVLSNKTSHNMSEIPNGVGVNSHKTKTIFSETRPSRSRKKISHLKNHHTTSDISLSTRIQSLSKKRTRKESLSLSNVKNTFKQTFDLLNRDSEVETANKKMHRKKRKRRNKNNNDVNILLIYESMKTPKKSKKRRKKPKERASKYYKKGNAYNFTSSDDIFGFRRNNRALNNYLYSANCNYQKTIRKLKSGFKRKKIRSKQQLNRKHTRLRVISSDLSTKGSSLMHYNIINSEGINNIQKCVQLHSRKYPNTNNASYRSTRNKKVGVTPSCLTKLAKCFCKRSVGTSKSLNRQSCTNGGRLFNDVNIHRSEPRRQSHKENGSLHSKTRSLHEPLHPLKDARCISTQYLSVDCDSLAQPNEKKLTDKDCVIKTTSKKEHCDKVFEKMTDIYTARYSLTKNLGRFAFLGVLVIITCPCIIAIALAWIVIYPLKLQYFVIKNKKNKSSNFFNKMCKKDCDAECQQINDKRYSARKRKGMRFLDWLSKWSSRVANNIANSVTAVLSVFNINKNIQVSETSCAAKHPDPKKKYSLFFTNNRGWMIKPVHRQEFTSANRLNNALTLNHECHFRGFCRRHPMKIAPKEQSSSLFKVYSTNNDEIEPSCWGKRPHTTQSLLSVQVIKPFQVARKRKRPQFLSKSESTVTDKSNSLYYNVNSTYEQCPISESATNTIYPRKHQQVQKRGYPHYAPKTSKVKSIYHLKRLPVNRHLIVAHNSSSQLIINQTKYSLKKNSYVHKLPIKNCKPQLSKSTLFSNSKIISDPIKRIKHLECGSDQYKLPSVKISLESDKNISLDNKTSKRGSRQQKTVAFHTIHKKLHFIVDQLTKYLEQKRLANCYLMGQQKHIVTPPSILPNRLFESCSRYKYKTKFPFKEHVHQNNTEQQLNKTHDRSRPEINPNLSKGFKERYCSFLPPEVNRDCKNKIKVLETSTPKSADRSIKKTNHNLHKKIGKGDSNNICGCSTASMKIEGKLKVNPTQEFVHRKSFKKHTLLTDEKLNESRLLSHKCPLEKIQNKKIKPTLQYSPGPTGGSQSISNGNLPPENTHFISQQPSPIRNMKTDKISLRECSNKSRHIPIASQQDTKDVDAKYNKQECPCLFYGKSLHPVCSLVNNEMRKNHIQCECPLMSSKIQPHRLKFLQGMSKSVSIKDNKLLCECSQTGIKLVPQTSPKANEKMNNVNIQCHKNHDTKSGETKKYDHICVCTNKKAPSSIVPKHIVHQQMKKHIGACDCRGNKLTISQRISESTFKKIQHLARHPTLKNQTIQFPPDISISSKPSLRTIFKKSKTIPTNDRVAEKQIKENNAQCPGWPMDSRYDRDKLFSSKRISSVTNGKLNWMCECPPEIPKSSTKSILTENKKSISCECLDSAQNNQNVICECPDEQLELTPVLNHYASNDKKQFNSICDCSNKPTQVQPNPVKLNVKCTCSDESFMIKPYSNGKVLLPSRKPGKGPSIKSTSNQRPKTSEQVPLQCTCFSRKLERFHDKLANQPIKATEETNLGKSTSLHSQLRRYSSDHVECTCLSDDKIKTKNSLSCVGRNQQRSLKKINSIMSKHTKNKQKCLCSNRKLKRKNIKTQSMLNEKSAAKIECTCSAGKLEGTKLSVIRSDHSDKLRSDYSLQSRSGSSQRVRFEEPLNVHSRISRERKSKVSTKCNCTQYDKKYMLAHKKSYKSQDIVETTKMKITRPFKNTIDKLRLLLSRYFSRETKCACLDNELDYRLTKSSSHLTSPNKNLKHSISQSSGPKQNSKLSEGEKFTSNNKSLKDKLNNDLLQHSASHQTISPEQQRLSKKKGNAMNCYCPKEKQHPFTKAPPHPIRKMRTVFDDSPADHYMPMHHIPQNTCHPTCLSKRRKPHLPGVRMSYPTVIPDPLCRKYAIRRQKLDPKQINSSTCTGREKKNVCTRRLKRTITGNFFSKCCKDIKEQIINADIDMWPNDINCDGNMYIHTLRNKPCFCVFRCCPSMYPCILTLCSLARNTCITFMYMVALICWSPFICCFSLYCCDICSCLRT